MKKKTSGSSSKDESPSQLIDARIHELGDWRGVMLSRLRALIKQAAPAVVEEWKWRGVPVWYQNGMICTGETYKSVVKVTFFKDAQMKDPKNSHPRWLSESASSDCHRAETRMGHSRLKR